MIFITRKNIITIAFALMLAAHAGLMLGALRRTFITVDEVGHVAAGLSYWTTGKFTIYRVNPPLSKMLAVLPVLAARPGGDYSEARDIPGQRAEWAAGPAFVSANEARVFELVCLARLAGVGWSVLGGLIVFRWARTLHGDAGGLLALGLWCVEPCILGHAPLVTADVPCAVAGLAATYAFVRYLNAPGWGRATWVGTLLGVAFLVKFTLVLFYGLWPLIWLIHRLARPVDDAPRDVRATMTSLGRLAVILVMSIYVINFGYGFRGTFKPLREYTFTSRAFTGIPADSADDGTWKGPGNRFAGGVLGPIPVPFPEDVLLGIDVQRRDFESRWRSYLGGEWRREGWWYYYLYALGIKLPIGSIALMLWGLGDLALRRGGSRRFDDLALILTSAGLLGFVSSQTGFNHHMRYAIPALPYLMINAGRLVAGAPRWRAITAGLLLGWAAVSSVAVYPHSLSHFNEAVGGPVHGHEHLLDSNIDWGQDLIHLKSWLDDHPEAKPLGLAYFNVVDPRLVGIAFDLPPSGLGVRPGKVDDRPGEYGPRPGYFAVSVNYLHGLQFNAPDGRGKLHYVHEPEFAYFNEFRPIARAGYSIYIYKITPEEADAARTRMHLPPYRPDPPAALATESPSRR